MMEERCYGVIALREEEGSWQVLLIQHQKEGFWGFPKGHPIKNETPYETACREFFEETGLIVESLLQSEPLIERYIYKKGPLSMNKTVLFYLCSCSGLLNPCNKELLDARWVSFEEAEALISFNEGKSLVKELKTLFC